MTEPNLVLEFENANLIIGRHEAVQLIGALSFYLNSLDQEFVPDNQAEKSDWN